MGRSLSGEFSAALKVGATVKVAAKTIGIRRMVFSN